MNKFNYEITRKNIKNVKLVSLTSQNWYDYDNNTLPWTSGSLYVGPSINDVVFNVSGSTISTGYYKWTGTFWDSLTKDEAYDSYKIPIYLESKLDEFGVMVGFDGNIEQVEQLINFSYSVSGNLVRVYSTTNSDKLRKIVEQNFTVDWGDGNQDTLMVNDTINDVNLPYVSHYYSGSTGYTITISLNSPWSTQKVSKIVKIPSDVTVTNPIGTYTGVTIPTISGYQNYLNDLDYTNNTGYTTTGFTYLAFGKSRISEKKLYGANSYSGVTTGSDVNGSYSAYTIDTLYYKDYSDGYTMITGTTVGKSKEEVFQNSLTRNEHFLGFVDEPNIYSDIFVLRGKQNVTEKNLRLCEIDNVGELDVYENQYFKIKKQ